MASGRPTELSLVAVGTQNPIKIQAVANAIQRIWPRVEVMGCDVESGVSDQPMGEAEAIRGATNRAIRSCRLLDADLGVGLEGYTVDTTSGMFLSAWVAIVGRNDLSPTLDCASRVGLGSGGRILVPEKLAEKVRQGHELGPLMDSETKQKDTKQMQGAVGILTNGLVERQEALAHGVLYALACFVSPIDY